MENGVFWTGCISLSFIDVIEVLRLMFGPLPPSLCWLQSFWRNGPTVGCVLFLDANVIYRVINTYCTIDLHCKLLKTFFSFQFFSSTCAYLYSKDLVVSTRISLLHLVLFLFLCCGFLMIYSLCYCQGK